jgi:hypothetical protein
VAGFILHLASWHWLFLINIPLGLAALVVGNKALPANPLAPRRFDRQSALLCMCFIGLLLYTIDAVGHLQASGWWRLRLLTGLSLFLLLKLQSSSAPMLPLDLLRIPLFALSIGTSFCSFAAQMAVFVMLPFMLQDYLGMSAARAGMLLSLADCRGADRVVAGKLSDRIAAGLLGGIGLAVMCLGLLSLLTMDHGTPDGVLAMFAVCGFGFGLFQSPNNRTMISAAPRERTGGASGMLGTARLTGQTVGASVVAMLLGCRMRRMRWCCAAPPGWRRWLRGQPVAAALLKGAEERRQGSGDCGQAALGVVVGRMGGHRERHAEVVLAAAALLRAAAPAQTVAGRVRICCCSNWRCCLPSRLAGKRASDCACCCRIRMRWLSCSISSVGSWSSVSAWPGWLRQFFLFIRDVHANSSPGQAQSCRFRQDLCFDLRQPRAPVAESRKSAGPGGRCALHAGPAWLPAGPSDDARRIWSSSMDSNRALKLPSPKPSLPLRWMIS